MLVKSLSLTQ